MTQLASRMLEAGRVYEFAPAGHSRCLPNGEPAVATHPMRTQVTDTSGAAAASDTAQGPGYSGPAKDGHHTTWQPACVMAYAPVAPTMCRITMVWVNPSMRGKGLGTAAVEHFCRHLRGLGDWHALQTTGGQTSNTATSCSSSSGPGEGGSSEHESGGSSTVGSSKQESGSSTSHSTVLIIADDSNPAANKAYHKAGFQPVARLGLLTRGTA